MEFKKELPKLDISNARQFLTDLPSKVKPEWLEGVDTNFQFEITEGDSAGAYTVAVQNNQMDVYEGFVGEANCKITAKEKNLLALVRGELNPMMAVFTGKVKISNPGEVMKYAKMFGMM